jgi:hypothetical protein
MRHDNQKPNLYIQEDRMAKTKRGKTMAFRKFIVRIEVEHEVAESLDKICGERGMTQLSLISRAVKWLGHQDAQTQIEIFGISAETSDQAIAKKLLKRMASLPDGKRPTKKG